METAVSVHMQEPRWFQGWPGSVVMILIATAFVGHLWWRAEKRKILLDQPIAVFRETRSVNPSSLKIAFWNVENLFDTEWDKDQKDPTYLPLAKKTGALKKKCAGLANFYYRKQCRELDWSPELLNQKMHRLAQTLFAQGSPDILAVSEVENRNVLALWNRKYLAAANYQTIELIEGPDNRGIDVGLISRYPLVRTSQLHIIPGLPHSRGILQVTLKIPAVLLKTELLTVFVFHFPSQGAPVEDRILALNELRRLMQSQPTGTPTIALGDSNITTREQQKLQLWDQLPERIGSLSLRANLLNEPGTHFYKTKWSFLDVIYVNAAVKGEMKSIHFEVLAQGPQQKKSNGTPERFKHEKGVSDHFPIAVTLSQTLQIPKSSPPPGSRHWTSSVQTPGRRQKILKPKIYGFRDTTTKVSRSKASGKEQVTFQSIPNLPNVRRRVD